MSPPQHRQTIEGWCDAFEERTRQLLVVRRQALLDRTDDALDLLRRPIDFNLKVVDRDGVDADRKYKRVLGLFGAELALVRPGIIALPMTGRVTVRRGLVPFRRVFLRPG